MPGGARNAASFRGRWSRRSCSFSLPGGGPSVPAADRTPVAARMPASENGKPCPMIILGLILLLIGVLLSIPILYTLGVILLIVGVVLMLVGRTGTAFAGRRHYW